MTDDFVNKELQLFLVGGCVSMHWQRIFPGAALAGMTG